MSQTIGRTSATTQAAADPFDRFPNAAAFVKKIGIRFPLCQAAMDLGPGMAELAAAVSNAGGMGAMGLSWHTEDEVRSFVTRARELTAAPFAAGFVMQGSWHGATQLAAALESGAPVILFSWGTLSPEMVALVRSFGAKIGIQISTALAARKAVDAGVDYISLQGQEAGGHVQAMQSWRDVIGSVLHEAGDVPVLVAGGLANGKALREVLSLGGAGGLLGTRFLATRESPAHDDYKRRLALASSADTMLTVCFDKGWTNALHRALRNPTSEMWEAAGSAPAGQRPGETDVTAYLGNEPLERYSIFAPNAAMTGDGIMDMVMYAGKGVDAIYDAPPVAELIHRMWSECTAYYLA
jgi:nitronate monooxygenase